MASIRKKYRNNGKPSYEVRIKLKGHPALSKSFRTRAEAEQWDTEQRSKIKSGGQVSRLPEKILVSDALQDYIDRTNPRPRKQVSLQWLRRYLDGFTVDSLTRQRIGFMLAELSKTEIPAPANRKKPHPLYDGNRKRLYSPGTIRAHYFSLKTALEWHALEYHYVLGDKFKGHDVPPSWAAPRDRRLEGDEENRLLDACSRMRDYPEGWRLLIRFALETACRAGELLKMQWHHVNEAQRFIVIPKEHEKTRRGRQVPLSKKAIAILAKLKRMKSVKFKHGARVFCMFPESSVALGRGFRRITKQAEISGLCFHDLRHEATSRFFERTALQTLEVALITGHTNQSTLQRYANLRPALLAEKLDGKHQRQNTKTMQPS